VIILTNALTGGRVMLEEHWVSCVFEVTDKKHEPAKSWIQLPVGDRIYVLETLEDIHHKKLGYGGAGNDLEPV
jgi:hypothetical protein